MLARSSPSASADGISASVDTSPPDRRGRSAARRFRRRGRRRRRRRCRRRGAASAASQPATLERRVEDRRVGLAGAGRGGGDDAVESVGEADPLEHLGRARSPSWRRRRPAARARRSSASAGAASRIGLEADRRHHRLDADLAAEPGREDRGAAPAERRQRGGVASPRCGVGGVEAHLGREGVPAPAPGRCPRRRAGSSRSQGGRSRTVVPSASIRQARVGGRSHPSILPTAARPGRRADTPRFDDRCAARAPLASGPARSPPSPSSCSRSRWRPRGSSSSPAPRRVGARLAARRLRRRLRHLAGRLPRPALRCVRRLARCSSLTAGRPRAARRRRPGRRA